MKTPGIRNSADPDQHSRPVMLKNKGPFKSLDVKIGDVRVEIWDYCKPVADPYACLIIQNGTVAQEAEGEKEKSIIQANVDQMHAPVLAHAIIGWAESLSCYLKGNATHALTVEIESLRLRLDGPSPENGDLRAELTFTGPGNLQKTATLTCLEARLLTEAFGVIIPLDHEEAE